MSEPIYVVSGTCGAYSDRCEWTVCWYDNQKDADAHAERAQKRSDELLKAGQQWSTEWPKSRPNEHDPWWQAGGGGWEGSTSYSVSELWYGDDLKLALAALGPSCPQCGTAPCQQLNNLCVDWVAK